jgi:hypothetical protein
MSSVTPARDVNPKIVAEWMQGSGRTAYFGDKVPELKNYYEPPRTPQLTAPKERYVVHDQIVLHTDYSKVVDLMNEGVALIGIKVARPNDPATRGSIEVAKLQNDGKLPGPYANATRFRVFNDGNYHFLRIDRSTGTWRPIPKAEAIDFLNSEMSYRQKLRRPLDSSHERIFEATTGRKWQPVFADFPNLKVSQLVQLPSDTPLEEFTYKGERHQMTAGSFLAGNLPKLRANCVSCGGPRGPGGPPGGPPHGRSSMVPPGGVSTKELANVWVNRGGWHLETAFTLGYGKAKSSSGSDNQ